MVILSSPCLLLPFCSLFRRAVVKHPDNKIGSFLDHERGSFSPWQGNGREKWAGTGKEHSRRSGAESQIVLHLECLFSLSPISFHFYSRAVFLALIISFVVFLLFHLWDKTAEEYVVRGRRPRIINLTTSSILLQSLKVEEKDKELMREKHNGPGGRVFIKDTWV